MEMEKIFRKILAKVKPGPGEIAKETAFAEGLVDSIMKMPGKHLRAEIVGSFARQTHLRGDNDIDIFVIFPQAVGRADFEAEGLRIGKAVFGKNRWVEAYSEHPYIRGSISGFDVEIVPSYDIGEGQSIVSSVDRSPLHNRFLRGKLSEQQKDEVRLLRQFLKGIGCYGADIKASSVPGYVTELLILKFGSFREFLRNASEWREVEVIDLATHLDENAAIKKFGHHFIVVDPIDKNRNVAAALSKNQYCRIIAASRAFLEKPSGKFFYPEKTRAWSVEKLRKKLSEIELVALKLPYPEKALPDVVYGQAKRFGRKTANGLEMHDFRIYRHSEWSDEKKQAIIVFELENLQIQKTKIHAGPPVTNAPDSKRFLAEHRNCTAGPRIVDGRWVVEKKREFHDARSLLKKICSDSAKTEKPPLKKALQKAAIESEEKLVQTFRKSPGFAEFLTEWLEGKEKFL
ncbi:MAG: CCA tRNA nucleotidyltransferase [Candidatus Diapherotrites archaeon]|nr:CCA tRNA nucleotidyltransferase [Candidatus Diapherotrites archaeon]